MANGKDNYDKLSLQCRESCLLVKSDRVNSEALVCNIIILRPH